MTDLEHLRRHGLFDAKVPRYTSYPPANKFSSHLNAERPEAWIAAMPAGAEMSVYVHIPFCRRLCWFCACRTQGTQTDAVLYAYVDTLKAEIAMIRERLPKDARMARLHLGGGTPTILPPDLLRELMSALEAAFPLAAPAEISVEIDPTEIDQDRMDVLMAFGLNRVSIGVQDFDPRVQRAIGREQSLEVTRDTLSALRAMGVRNVNIDLLYGLPFQDEASLRATLDDVIALQPNRIALFGYAHVPWMSKRQVMIPDDALPTAEQRFALFGAATRRLMSDGYAQIGIDHFAQPGDGLCTALEERRLNRNFQGYTDDGLSYLIGLGASAISRYPQGYIQNHSATAIYNRAVRDGHPAWARGCELSARDRVIAQMIQHILCYARIEASQIVPSQDMGRAEIEAALHDLHGRFADVTSYRGGIFSITRSGHALSRIIAASLDDTHTFGQGQHSMAV